MQISYRIFSKTFYGSQIIYNRMNCGEIFCYNIEVMQFLGTGCLLLFQLWLVC